MLVKPSQAASMITKYIKARLVPMLVGSPGCGKSQIVHKIAKEYNLKLIDLRLSQCDPCDLLGFPSIANGKAGYVPMETFPIEGDEIPEGYSGWLLFLDEFNSAPPAVQAAAYKLTLDKMVGIKHLHKNVAIVCAGNLETDNAIVQPMSTALQSRLVHLELQLDQQEWNNHAADQGWDHRLTSWINFKPGMLFTFKADHTDQTYACPRTYEFANRILGVVDDSSPDLLPMLAGALSEGVAREMLTFFKIHKSIATIPQIRANPEGIKVPDEPSVIWALTGSISHHASVDNMEDLMKFVNRIPAEFQVVCLRETVRRNRALLTHPSVQKWISSSAASLF